MNDLQSRMIATVAALFLMILGGTIGFHLGGKWLAVNIEIVLLITIILLRRAFFPQLNRYKFTLSVLSTYLLLISLLSKNNLWIGIGINYILQIVGLPEIEIPVPDVVFLVLTISGFLMIIFIVIREKRNVIHPPHIENKSEKTPFKEPDYKKLRDMFCSYMVGELDKLDRDTNWSDNYFTTLEAEVEMQKNVGLRSKIAPNLINAIKKDQESNAFILIGDPGSGKSVSLRRLTREMYKSVFNQNEYAVVPVYINLKEWQSSRKITDDEIARFAYKYLYDNSGREGKGFLKNYYDKMLSNGMLFFVFDSFDEMPQVLDCDDQDSKLKEISQAFDTFFRDLHNCRGILASRPFRQPVGFRGRKLTILPFRENQVRKAMKKWLMGEGLNAQIIVRNLLVERPHLSSALKNPFMSDLIAQYIICSRDKLPKSYYELFDHYINLRFDEDTTVLNELRLNKNQVIETAKEIAKIIFNSEDIGLEVDVKTLKEKIDDPIIEDKIKVMEHSRIIRFGGNSRERLSFVHRRFAEYFSVCSLLDHPEIVKKDSIPTDSRWRDSLVVYCGIAPKEKVESLAKYAWETLIGYKDILLSDDVINARPAVHCLRFLRDACQSRPECMNNFRIEFSEFVIQLINSEDVLAAKIATESLRLLESKWHSSGLVEAFKRKIFWITETALLSSRHLPEIGSEAVEQIIEYIKYLPSSYKLENIGDIKFSLSLSESLKPVKVYFWIDIINILILWLFYVVFISLLVIKKQTDLFLFCILITLLTELYYKIFHIWKSREEFSISLRVGIVSSMFFWLLRFKDIYHIDHIFIGSVFIVILVNVNFLQDYIFNTINIIIHLRQFDRNKVLEFIKIYLRRLLEFAVIAMIVLVPFGLALRYIDKVTKYMIPFLYILSPLLIVVSVVSMVALISTNGIKIIFATFIKGIVGFVRYYVYLIKDYLYIKKIVLITDISWLSILNTLKHLNSEWGQLRYLRLLNSINIIVSSYFPTIDKSFLKGLKAESEFSQLREKILGLSE